MAILEYRHPSSSMKVNPQPCYGLQKAHYLHLLPHLHGQTHLPGSEQRLPPPPDIYTSYPCGLTLGIAPNERLLESLLSALAVFMSYLSKVAPTINHWQTFSIRNVIVTHY
jgi:hypothetical protein